MRLDILVSERLGISRTRAQNLIKTGGVSLERNVILKTSYEVADDAQVSVKDTLKYASLGGLKLENAIDKLSIHLSGAICLDLGAANGGFTDCLLKHGAKEVSAVDLTIAFPDELRQDPRVKIYDGVNVKSISDYFTEESFDFICVDLSFISLCGILPSLSCYLKMDGRLLILFKPQFEVGRKALPKSGVVRDKKQIDKAYSRLLSAADAAGLDRIGDCPIPDIFPDKNPERTVLFFKKNH